MCASQECAMPRAGFRIFDSALAVGPYLDAAARSLCAGENAHLAAGEPYRAKSKGHPVYHRGARRYLRKLGAAQAQPDKGGYMSGFTGAKREREPSERGDHDPAERIKDLDYEGVDVNLTLPSGWFGTWTAGDDIALEAAMYRAYHRWMEDYCGAYPERLGGVILVGARDVKSGLEEVKRCGNSRWAWAVRAYAPYGVPLDHPSLEPVWAAAQDHDLAVVLHTFTVMPPYAPGGLDTWENLWLQGSAAHPWCGMRNMAALIGAGVMDRYSKLRVATLEAGHGWLPFWMQRIDEHAETIAAAIPELKA